MEFDQDSTLHGEELGGDAPGPLREVTAEERKEMARARKRERTRTVKKAAAKTTVSVWDNLDAVCGAIERVFFLAVAELLRRGDWLSAGLVCALMLVAWLVKVRRPEPGAVVKFFRKDTAEIRQIFVDAANTIKRG